MSEYETREDTEVIHDALVNLFREIMDIEQDAIITEEFSDITNNDMHIIAAIGDGEAPNMSAIAHRMSVTMGTLSISVNQLVKKGYVLRERSQEDRRVIFLRLTEKGECAYRHHANFHQAMLEAGLQGLDDAERQALAGLLSRLKVFFESYRL